MSTVKKPDSDEKLRLGLPPVALVISAMILVPLVTVGASKIFFWLFQWVGKLAE